MHISVGAMDGHTQLLFYGMCFGPFLVLVAVAYREHRRSSRADPLEPSVPHDTDHYLAPELRRATRPAAGAQSQHDNDDEEYGSTAGVQPPV
jgi:hypothetical protein